LPVLVCLVGKVQPDKCLLLALGDTATTSLAIASELLVAS
jgi:hypothetical protein